MLKVLLTAFLMALATSTFAASPTAYDADHDGTLDLAEMEAAAAAAFNRLNSDADRTLDYTEAKGSINKKAFMGGDPDNDGTLTKEEYLRLAEKLFNGADLNKDGVLDARELNSCAGRTLQKLLH